LNDETKKYLISALTSSVEKYEETLVGIRKEIKKLKDDLVVVEEELVSLRKALAEVKSV
jgi:hypothetical protein